MGWVEDIWNFCIEVRLELVCIFMLVKFENLVFGIDDYLVNEIYDDLKWFWVLLGDLFNGLNIDCLVVVGYFEGNLKLIWVVLLLGGNVNGSGFEVVIWIIFVIY